MSLLKVGGIVGTGGIGVLAVAIITSDALNNGLTWLFGLALIIFVTAGAIALVAKSTRYI